MDAGGKIALGGDAKLRGEHLLLSGVRQAGFPTVQTDLAATEHFVRGDPARLQQVFWNLLSNAHKFTPAGGKITVITSNPQPQRIRIEVSDTGVGIDPQILPRLFQPFEQGDAARKSGGLGLGLAISKALIDAHGGTLAAHSAGLNQGATFVIELAAVEQPARATAPSAQTVCPTVSG